MKNLIFAALVLGNLSNAHAECLELTKNILATQNILIVDPTLKRTSKEFDSKKIKKKQAELTAKFIYDRPGVFDNGDDFDVLMESDTDFTHVSDYEKGSVKVRAFEVKKAGTMTAIRLKVDKKMTVFTVDKSCEPQEVVLIDGGARCFFKKDDCQKLIPLDETKLKTKCSFLTDLSKATVSLMAQSCGVFEKSNSAKADAGAKPTSQPVVTPTGNR